MNIGFIRVSNDLLLDWLQFSGGKVLDAQYDLRHDAVDIYIEHPEMPEHEKGEMIVCVNPSYIKYQDSEGHLVALREPLRNKGE